MKQAHKIRTYTNKCKPIMLTKSDANVIKICHKP